MSLRLRIALLMAVLAATATIAVGAISYQTTSSRLLRAVDDSLVDATAVATARRFDERLFEAGPFDGVVVQAVLEDGSIIRSNFPRPLPPTKNDLALIGRPGSNRFQVGSSRASRVSNPLDRVRRWHRSSRTTSRRDELGA